MPATCSSCRIAAGTGARRRRAPTSSINWTLSPARNQLLVDLHYVHLTDQLAAVTFLAAQPYVDATRIGNMGFSFGGIQTVYAIGNFIGPATTSIQGYTQAVSVSAEARAGAGRYRAVVDCSGGAQSWVGNNELQTVMRQGVAKAAVPVFFIQAANDYSLLPNSTLSADMTAQAKPNAATVYPAVGATNQDGHEFCTKGAATWGPDVLLFFAPRLGAHAITVIEYYNVSLDHYFITHIAGEIAILDAGVTIKGWSRTGKTFLAYLDAAPGTSPVCRFYIPPDKGDSHFFGRGTAECNATGQRNPTFVNEEPNFMQMFLPTAGVCPATSTQVFRVFSNRPDANHRYMTDKATRDQMVGRGWLPEGDGADLVVMCAPQ
jgi:dienelactone hydrolase